MTHDPMTKSDLDAAPAAAAVPGGMSDSDAAPAAAAAVDPSAVPAPAPAAGAVPEAFARTARLYGRDRMQRLMCARVAVFGIGGVGGMAAEALVRSGIGAIDLIDFDTVDVTNINRQLWALTTTVGRLKTETAAERLTAISPAIQLTLHPVFVTAENADDFPFEQFDYVIDAMDNVTAKIHVIEAARRHGVPVISAMGAGNKINPAAFEVADIQKTSVCPLARVMRRELRKLGIIGVKVVYSKEVPLARAADAAADRPVESAVVSDAAAAGERMPEVGTGAVSGGQDEVGQMSVGGFVKQPPGSAMFGAAAAGLLIAAEVVSDLSGLNRLHTDSAAGAEI